MAEAVVSIAADRLANLLISEATFLYGVRGEIEDIQREMKRMQCFLAEADKKQTGDERVKKWVSDMRELAFKTEDVIETYAYKRQKSGFKHLKFPPSLYKIGKEIKSIRAELFSLTATLQTYGITKGLEQGETSNSMLQKNVRIFYPHDVEKDFVGMKKDIEQLISHLRKDDAGCEVISICGMGGQGKTTVATQLYNHAQVQSHFGAFGWVCITQQFDSKTVLKSILQQLLPAARKKDVLSMLDEVMIDELHKVLKQKKCLIVIDDIWTADAWRNLRSAFPIGETKSGSKILLTTRNEMVAEVGSVYKLPSLTEDEGWQLLSMKAFHATEDSSVIEGMESIGRQIVLRCKGLPLAVSTVGGMLKGKTFKEWESISRDIKLYLARGDEIDEYHTVSQILGLSYDSLPPRLRLCFLCLANYKEDEEIDVEKLFLYWIAEGLISVEDKSEGEMMLNVAERYLDELARRSLVQLVPRVEGGSSNMMADSWSRSESCRVHDLIRELCLSKAKEEKVIRVDFDIRHDHDSESRGNRIRRLCIYKRLDMYESCVHIPQIRSLLMFKAMPSFSLAKFILLRTLIVEGSELDDEHLKSICTLFYLKYLSLNGSYVNGLLPSMIGDLRNLEILDLRVRYGSRMEIPDILRKLRQLKHLYLPNPAHNVVHMVNSEKVRIDGMNELELIEGFDSSYCEGADLVGLNKIKVFEGFIRIEVNEETPMIINNIIDIINSKKLHHMRLHINGEKGVSLLLLLECGFIDSLYIHAGVTALPKEYDHNSFSVSGRLTTLYLWNCKIEEYDPMILLEKLPNLRKLHLGSNTYMGREMICSTMGFPQLQLLCLDELPNLINLRIDEGALPNLSKLIIYYCDKLEMLPNGLRFLASLKHLHIRDMPPAFKDRIRVINGVEGPDVYEVRHIPTIIIY